MLAIIGGTGLYNLQDIKEIKKLNIKTPFGKPSAPLIHGKLHGQDIVFLARHGENHNLLPHEINYRANIWALKSLGVTKIISFSAIGSLQEKIKPGDFVLTSQYFDWIHGNRDDSFFGNGLIVHVSMAKPTCELFAKNVIDVAKKLKIKLHTETTLVCINGPRFSTKAESLFFKNVAKCDVIGMTSIPEAFLAREAQICYCPISIVTDYDCFKEDPKEHVSAADVIIKYKDSLNNVKNLLKELSKISFDNKNCACRHSLKDAVLTPIDKLAKNEKQLLELLRK